MSVFDKEKTVTDMEFVDLLEQDVALRQAKFSIMYTTETMQQYNEAFFFWKKDYRGRYSEKYLERSGFDPTSLGVNVSIDNTLILSFLQNTIDPSAQQILSSSVSNPSIDYQARNYMRENSFVWSNSTNTLIYDGTTYTTFSASYQEIAYASELNTDIIVMSFGRNPGDLFPLEIQIPNIYKETVCLNMKYSSGTPEWHIAVVPYSLVNIPIGEESDIVMSAIVPLIEDEVLSLETLELKRILNKFGLGGGELLDSLIEDEDGEPSEVDNAYIMEGLRFDKNDEDGYLALALFKSFDYLANIGGSTSFGMSKMSMTYGFDAEKTAIPGRYIKTIVTTSIDEFGEEVVETETELPMKTGDYWSELTGEGEESLLQLFYQETDTTTVVLSITNYYQNFTISGVNFTAYLDSPPEEGRLLIPLPVLNDLSFREFVVVHEHSFQLLVYANKTITIKWYQRGIFQFIFTVIITYLTAGAGTTFVTVLTNAIVNFAVAFAINTIVGAINNEYLTLIVAVALTAFQMNQSGFDFANLTVENYLPMANKIIDSASNIYSSYVETEIKRLKVEAEAQAEEDELLLEQMNPGIAVSKAMMDAHFTYMGVNGPDAWIQQMLGSGMYNFDQYFNVGNEIDIRKKVESG